MIVNDSVWRKEERIAQSEDRVSIRCVNPAIIWNYSILFMVWEGLNTNSNLNEVYYRTMLSYDGSGNTTISSSSSGAISPFGTVTTISDLGYNVSNPTIGVIDDQTAVIYYQRRCFIFLHSGT